jgi:uncharacterized repeat protein (TIGR04138 family)
MTDKVEMSICDLAERVGRYPPEAFVFLQQGLDFTVRRTHGAAAKHVRRILRWLEERGASPSDLPALLAEEALPSTIDEFVQQAGGVDAAMQKLNLHVGGDELCWGLRDLALQRWGLMAPTVLGHWGIRSTEDFGNMVFAMVENGMLQKQPDDEIGDFAGVFDFGSAFDGEFRIRVDPSGGDTEDEC